MKINVAFLSIISLYHFNEYFVKFVQLTIDGADLAKFETKRPLVAEFGITVPSGSKFWKI